MFIRPKMYLSLYLAVCRSPDEPSAPPPVTPPVTPPVVAPAAVVPPVTPPVTPPVVVAKPDPLPDRFWNPEKNEIRWNELNSEMEVLGQFKAEADVRMQGVPKDGNYAISLDGVQLPEGIEFKLDENHPIVKPAREWAKEAGIPQEQFSKLIGLYAQSKAAEVQEFNTKIAAERAKLGAESKSRVEAVGAALRGRVGDKADAIMPMLVTAAAVEALEAVLRTTSARGPGNPGNPNAVQDYSKMSPLEKIHVAHERAAKKAA